MFWKRGKLTLGKPWSITNKLTFLYGSATCLILILLAIAAYLVVRQVILTAEKQYIFDEVNVIQNLLQKHPHQLSSLTQEVNAVPESLTSAEYRYYIRIYDNHNKTLMITPGMDKALPDPKFPPLDEKNWHTHSIHWRSANGRDFLSMTAPLNQDNLIMQMAFDGTYPETLINQYRNNAIFFLLLSMGMVIILGRILTLNGLRRLYEMIHTMEEITTEKLTHRIEIKGWPKELIPLGNAFNKMLTRFENGFQRLAECTTELAHELRTPVHNLMLATEILLTRCRKPQEYKVVLESNFEEYQRLSNIIDSVLFLARTENPEYSLNKRPIVIEDKLIKIIDFYRITAAEKDITISFKGKGLINADPILLERAIGNILSNAIQHTPNGGSIGVTARFIPNSSSTQIIIKDTGMGIPEEHLNFIFDRFYRVKSSPFYHTAGIGLGLAIVKSIVDLHQGSIAIQSKLGKGTALTLNFPSSHKLVLDYVEESIRTSSKTF